jgi:hypothetical protein
VRLREAIEFAVKIDEARRLGRPTLQPPFYGPQTEREPMPVAQALAHLDQIIMDNARGGFSIDLMHIQEPRGGQRPELSFHPDNLNSAIWLQFAMAIGSGHQRIHRCLWCDRLLLSTTSGKRDIRLTCNASHRHMYYVRRRSQAVEMHAAGRTVDAVAQELGIEAATVKSAIKAAAKGKASGTTKPGRRKRSG